jgi:cell division protein FtsW (lipid II flippase)
MLFVSYGGSSIMSGCLLLGMTFSALKKETGTI